MVVRHLGAEVDALVVHAALQADRRGLRLRRLVVVAVENVAHRAAVRNHVALEAPLAAQLILQAETRWRTPAAR